MNDGHPADGKEKRFSSLLKLFGRGKRDEDVTEEIMDMVNESHEQGVLEENEAEMIGNIFEFGEKQASDVMTHRNNIVALDDDITVEEAFNRVMEENYSRYPVYEGDIDNITGVLHIRDLLKIYVDKDNQGRKLKDVGDTILFKPYCIPETRNISPLFRQMQSDKIHMAIVVDEYGQTAGIITMEDILEEIVGNILDEYDEEEEQIITEEDGSYIIEGQADLEDVEAKLGIEFECEDIDTLSGFMIYKLGKIPDEGESFEVEYKGYIFKTLEVRNRMILKVKVEKMKQEENA
ncbi:MAG: hemolysin family protein [Eubacteriales bacterium]|nr:hemolysin family protein [Eubacteriales bacterium]